MYWTTMGMRGKEFNPFEYVDDKIIAFEVRRKDFLNLV